MRRKDREISEINEIEEIIKLCKTCHLGMVDNGKPYVVPLSVGYQLVNNQFTLYFHCAHEGRKIDVLKKNNDVFFEMCDEGIPIYAKETPCNSGYEYSSVMGTGKAFFIEDDEEKASALSKIVYQQAGIDFTFSKKQTDTVCVFKIEVDQITGKRKKRPVAPAE